jgi:hypothetical protein
MLRYITLQCVGVWISTVLPCICICSWPYAYSIRNYTKFDLPPDLAGRHCYVRRRLSGICTALVPQTLRKLQTCFVMDNILQVIGNANGCSETRQAVSTELNTSTFGVQ